MKYIILAFSISIILCSFFCMTQHKAYASTYDAKNTLALHEYPIHTMESTSEKDLYSESKKDLKKENLVHQQALYIA